MRRPDRRPELMPDPGRDAQDHPRLRRGVPDVSVDPRGPPGLPTAWTRSWAAFAFNRVGASGAWGSTRQAAPKTVTILPQARTSCPPDVRDREGGIAVTIDCQTHRRLPYRRRQAFPDDPHSNGRWAEQSVGGTWSQGRRLVPQTTPRRRHRPRATHPTPWCRPFPVWLMSGNWWEGRSFGVERVRPTGRICLH
jgi:hypothetical protein